MLLYERKLLNEPAISRKLSDIYHGYAEPQAVTLELSNADGYFSWLIAHDDEIRGVDVRLRRYEPLAPPQLSFDVSGKITDYTLNADDVFSVTVSINDPDPLQREIARKVLETSDWSWGVNPTAQVFLPSQDLGKSYPLGIGYARKSPLIYVKADHTLKRYDYIISYGEIMGVVNLYRNRRLVNMAAEGITVHVGDSSSPYSLTIGGVTTYFAYIRCPLEQRDFSGALMDLTADVRGMRMGTANMQKNFARVIQQLLSNQAWGLGLAVNAAAFDAAAAQSAADYPECTDYVTNLDGGCSGSITEPVRAYDLLAGLLLACRGQLTTNESNEWTLTVDTYKGITAATFGDNDGSYNNCDMLSIKKSATSEASRNITLNYAFDGWQGKYAHRNIRACRSFGEDRQYEMLLVRDHTTADRITSYLRQLALHDTRIQMRAGMEARGLQVGDVVRLINLRWGIDVAYQVREIERGAIECNLELSSYSSAIYTYTAGSIPAEAYDDATPDYSATPPAAPTSFAIDTGFGTSGWRVDMAQDGTVFMTVGLLADAPSVNFANMEFGGRRAGDTIYAWTAGNKPGAGATWRGRIEGLTAGLNYEFAARAVNGFGLYSTLATIGSTTAPGDATAPGTVSGLVARCKLKTWEFQWTALTGVADLRGYRLQINSSSGFGGTMYHNAILNAVKKSYSDDSLSYGDTLHARVRAVDLTGNESASWSSTASATASRAVSDDISSGAITTPKRQTVNTISYFIASIPANSGMTIGLPHNLDRVPVGIVTSGNTVIQATLAFVDSYEVTFLIRNPTGSTVTNFTITFYYW